MPTPDHTSLDAIVAAGRDLLEAGGPDGLTMRAVADRVGVRAPSLYKRMRDKAALRRLVADATADDLAARFEDVSGFPAQIRAFRNFAHERPEGFRLLFFSGAASQEAIERASSPVLGLADALSGQEHALEAARLVTAWATGFVSMELAGAFHLGGDLDKAFEFGIERISRALSEPAP